MSTTFVIFELEMKKLMSGFKETTWLDKVTMSDYTMTTLALCELINLKVVKLESFWTKVSL